MAELYNMWIPSGWPDGIDSFYCSKCKKKYRASLQTIIRCKKCPNCNAKMGEPVETQEDE